jgi:5'-nucleotidase
MMTRNPIRGNRSFHFLPMRMLLSNDDGCDAPGLEALATGLADLGEIVVVAPDRNRSGASNSLTLDVPLRVRLHAPNRYCVNGTPTDCVHLALTGLLSEEPDIVVSGINDGANLGDDVLYSGTVAAAMEGRTLGTPALAVSLLEGEGEERPYETAVRVVRDLLAFLPKAALPPNTVLNVNVPARPYEALEGFRATRLGSRHRASGAVADRDPRGRRIYWVGSAGRAADAGEGTDFEAVQKGYVSVTPLQIDLTRHAVLPLLERWLGSASLRG